MKTENYKREKYFDTSKELLNELNKICNTLLANLNSDSDSHKVSDINKRTKPFNDLFRNTKPNNPNGNKYSKKEFKGIYAFAEVKNNKVDFMYLGISQTIRRRFGGHTRGKTKLDASWAYLMIKHKHPNLSIIGREKKIPDYQKNDIYPLRFTFCPIDDNMLMHIAEVYCVNKLKAFWNTFETH